MHIAIGVQWERLATALAYNNKDINEIIANNPRNVYSQCHTMLYKYYQSNGSSFTKLVLAEALVKVGLLAVAESYDLLEISTSKNSNTENPYSLQGKSIPSKKNKFVTTFYHIDIYNNMS